MYILAISESLSINVSNITFFTPHSRTVHFVSERAKQLTPDQTKTFVSKLFSSVQNFPSIIILPNLMVNMAHVELLTINAKDEHISIDFINKAHMTIDTEDYQPFITLINNKAPKKKGNIILPKSFMQ